MSADTDWRPGWLSPSGQHYPCAFYSHDELADKLGDGTFDLEVKGWVRITEDDFDRVVRAVWAPSHFPTEAQAKWLLDNDVPALE